MKKLFALALVALFALAGPMSAMAQQAAPAPAIDTRGLTESQILELQKQAADARAGTPEATVEKISAYVEIGKGIGTGLGAAARELGIAVNEFAKSPVGQVTMALIVFKVAGGKILGIVGSVLWFSIMIPMWVFFFNRICMPKTVYETFHENGKRKDRQVTPASNDDEVLAGYRFVMLLVLAAISGAGFIMAFA